MKYVEITERPETNWPRPVKSLRNQAKGFLYSQEYGGFDNRKSGKFLVPAKDGKQPKERETWVCDLVRETDRAQIVRLLDRAEDMEWGWSFVPANTKGSNFPRLGQLKPVATPVKYPWLRSCDAMADALVVPDAVAVELERLLEMLKFRHAQALDERLFESLEPVRALVLGQPTRIVDKGGKFWDIHYPPTTSPGGEYAPIFGFRGVYDPAQNFRVVPGSAVRDGETVTVEIFATYGELVSDEPHRVTAVERGALRNGFGQGAGVEEEVRQSLMLRVTMGVWVARAVAAMAASGNFIL